MKITAKNIVKTYRNRRVVDGISLDVKQGEIVGLLGPNGAGKTTSFYMMVGLVKPNEGHVYLDDEDVTDQPMYRRAQMGIGYLAQEASVFRKLSVEDNISRFIFLVVLPYRFVDSICNAKHSKNILKFTMKIIMKRKIFLLSQI